MKAVVLCAIATSAVLLTGGQAQPPPSPRIALIKHLFVPNGTSAGPQTMASGGIQDALKALGATVRVSEIFRTYPKASAIGPRGCARPAGQTNARSLTRGIRGQERHRVQPSAGGLVASTDRITYRRAWLPHRRPALAIDRARRP